MSDISRRCYAVLRRTRAPPRLTTATPSWRSRSADRQRAAERADGIALVFDVQGAGRGARGGGGRRALPAARGAGPGRHRGVPGPAVRVDGDPAAVASRAAEQVLDVGTQAAELQAVAGGDLPLAQAQA